jgi:hypothetical protein
LKLGLRRGPTTGPTSREGGGGVPPKALWGEGPARGRRNSWGVPGSLVTGFRHQASARATKTKLLCLMRGVRVCRSLLWLVKVTTLCGASRHVR